MPALVQRERARDRGTVERQAVQVAGNGWRGALRTTTGVLRFRSLRAANGWVLLALFRRLYDRKHR